MGWERVDAEQRLQPLERQFDLPAQPVGGEHLFGGIALARQGGAQDDEFRRLEAARIECFLPLRGFAAQLGASRFGGLGRFADREQADRQGALARSDPRQNLDLPRTAVAGTAVAGTAVAGTAVAGTAVAGTAVRGQA